MLLSPNLWSGRGHSNDSFVPDLLAALASFPWKLPSSISQVFPEMVPEKHHFPTSWLLVRGAVHDVSPTPDHEHISSLALLPSRGKPSLPTWGEQLRFCYTDSSHDFTAINVSNCFPYAYHLEVNCDTKWVYAVNLLFKNQGDSTRPGSPRKPRPTDCWNQDSVTSGRGTSLHLLPSQALPNPQRRQPASPLST